MLQISFYKSFTYSTYSGRCRLSRALNFAFPKLSASLPPIVHAPSGIGDYKRIRMCGVDGEVERNVAYGTNKTAEFPLTVGDRVRAVSLAN